jgi:hypothetical protein
MHRGSRAAGKVRTGRDAASQKALTHERVEVGACGVDRRGVAATSSVKVSA